MKIYAFLEVEVLNVADLGAVLSVEIKQRESALSDPYISIVDKEDASDNFKKLPEKGDYLTAIVAERKYPTRHIDIILHLEDLEK